MLLSCDNRKFKSSINAIIATDKFCDFRNNRKIMEFEWIKERVDKERGLQARLAEFIGISSDKLNKTLTGVRKFKPPELLKVAEYFRLSINEVMTGSPEADGFTNVPVYNVRASAGNGRIIDKETYLYDISFRTSWLHTMSISSLSNLACAFVEGDSMEPTLSNNDSILLDIGQHNFKNDGIYMIQYDGEGLIKRLQYNPQKNTVKVISDNKMYQPIEISNFSTFKVIGRALWTGRKL